MNQCEDEEVYGWHLAHKQADEIEDMKIKDRFEAGRPANSMLDTPCNGCKHSYGRDDEFPCSKCFHNVNAR